MAPADRFGPAVALVLLAMLSFTAMDTISKILVETYAITQILCVRYVCFLGFAVWLVGRRGLAAAARPRRPGLLLATGVLLIVENATFVLAYRYLPIADVQAVAAAAPLIVVALSVPLLGEKVGIRRWLAVAAGFGGVLLIVRPGFASVSWQTAVPVAGALMWGLYQVLVRRVTRQDSAQTVTLWMAAVGLAAAAAGAPLSWQAPDAEGWTLLLAVALLGSTGHFFLIKAFEMHEASRLQPFAYSQLLWSVAAGIVVFGDVPDGWVTAGAGLVVASGLYAWYRQRQRGDVD